jgi:predicted dinucleotide-binding enzyme
MKVGIIGSGRIGGTLAFLVSRIGHDVLVGSRNPAARVALEEPLAGRGRVAEIDGAAEFGDLVILAAPWAAAFAGDALPSPERCKGKIVVDAMNPFRPGGGLFDLARATSTGVIAGRLPGARVVKAFNTLPGRRSKSRRTWACPAICPSHEDGLRSPFSVISCLSSALFLTQPNHGHFGTDVVGSSIIQ